MLGPNLLVCGPNLLGSESSAVFALGRIFLGPNLLPPSQEHNIYLYEYTSDCFSSQLAMDNPFVITEDSNMGHVLLSGQICINSPLNPLRFVLKDLKRK